MTDPGRLARFLATHERLFVLTGAGCSTDSGIPDYRDGAGAWKRRQPMTFQEFRNSKAARRRYWARSLYGWPAVAAARPNAAHRQLAALEALRRLEVLVTQNVDGLHRAAGSRQVIDLHGRLDTVVCLDCGLRSRRGWLQQVMEAANPGVVPRLRDIAPDGDADIDPAAIADFTVPACPTCGGILKPDVVFFGENVPGTRVARVWRCLARADAVLVVGSSLMVRSGLRFVQAAAERGLPLAAVNLGRTRADDLFDLKLNLPAGEALTETLARLPRLRRRTSGASAPAVAGAARPFVPARPDDR